MPIQLRNPHSVLAVLETRPRDVLRISVPSALVSAGSRQASGGNVSASGDAWGQVVRVARELGVSVQSVPKGAAPSAKNTDRTSVDGGRGSAYEALIQERAPIAVERLFENASEKAQGKGLWLALDSLQDPQNLGAIFRTASFFGVQGILLTQERSAPLTGTVYDVASGGVESVPFATCVNLNQAFQLAKDSGLWILGTSEHCADSLFKIEKDRPWLLVLGNEERGMRRLTEESCDLVCGIPSRGAVSSLNVSVAAGICIAHLS